MVQMQPSVPWGARAAAHGASAHGAPHEPGGWEGASPPSICSSPGELGLCSVCPLSCHKQVLRCVHVRRLVFFSMVLTKRKGRIWKCLGTEIFAGKPAPSHHYLEQNLIKRFFYIIKAILKNAVYSEHATSSSFRATKSHYLNADFVPVPFKVRLR